MYENRSRQTIGAMALLSFSVISLSGCMVADPYLKPTVNTFRDAPTLSNAVKYADDTRELYYDGIRQHGGFNRVVGASLIGAAAAAVGLGIGNGHNSTITALGLGGASLYGLTTWLELKPKMLVYQAGIEALNCTLSIYGPLRTLDTDALTEALKLLPGEIVELQARLNSARKGIRSPTDIEQSSIERAAVILRNGENALKNGREARHVTRRAGVGLYEATQAVRIQVTKGLIDVEGDLSELVASLQKTIPVNASLITGRSSEPTPAGSGGSLKHALLNPLEDAAAKVHARTQVIEGLIAGLGQEPSADLVAGCAHIDPVKAGFSFRSSPRSNVFLNAGQANQSSRVLLSGGQPPYWAEWTGQVPADIELTVNHLRGENVAEVLLTPNAQTTAGTYAIEVGDSGTSSRAVKTLVVTVTAPGSSEIRVEPPPSLTRRDPKVSTLQTLLVDNRCLAALNSDDMSSIDGISGDQTKAAIARYLDAMFEGDNDAIEAKFDSKDAPNIDKLITEISDLRDKRLAKEKKKESVKEFLCSAVSSS